MTQIKGGRQTQVGEPRTGREAEHEISEEGRRARFDQWEQLGLDVIRTDLEATGGLRFVGGPPQVRKLAWEWVRIKEAEPATTSILEPGAGDPLSPGFGDPLSRAYTPLAPNTPPQAATPVATALSQIQNTLTDLLAADHNTYDRHIKRLSRALHAPELDTITRKLTEGIDLASGVPSWPAEPEKELGTVGLLVDHFADQPSGALKFAMTYYHHGSRRPADDLQNMTRDMLVPFVRDYIIHVEATFEDHAMGIGSPAGIAGMLN